MKLVNYPHYRGLPKLATQVYTRVKPPLVSLSPVCSSLFSPCLYSFPFTEIPRSTPWHALMYASHGPVCERSSFLKRTRQFPLSHLYHAIWQSTPQISPGTKKGHKPILWELFPSVTFMRHDLSTLPETKELNKAWQPSKAEGAKRTKAETVPRPSCPVFHPSFFHYVEVLFPKVKSVSVIAKPTGPTTLGNPINI